MRFDRQKFFDAYTAAFGALKDSQRAGLEALLTAAEADTEITDIRWLAYMFATVKHECAGTWRPIEEYGKGQGHKYGVAVTVTDPEGKSYSNVYYGRGYVQLTWDYNYRNMGKVLNNRLLYEPSLALDAAVAYRIMSYGMRNGSFTGAKLSRFISGETCDYKNARKIINGLDQADRIAGYAVKLEAILRASAVAAVPGGVPVPQPATPADPTPAQPAATGQAMTVTASSLNVRSGPGSSNPVVAGSPLAQGTKVHAQQTQDGWTHVVADGSGVTGWVSAKYLQAVAAPATLTVTADSLNVRSGPGSSNATVGAPLPKGTQVQSLGEQDGWTHVTVPSTGVTGWASSKYLQPAGVPAHA
jgi:putative chitinase